MFERVLILETSGRVGQAALASGEFVVAEERLGEERRRASDLAMVIDRLLKVRGWRARDLTAVVVGLGPGSYTGLRVGLASAKALAYATGCAFLGVETFAAMAIQAPTDAKLIRVVADALQGKLFHRDYANQDGQLRPTTPLEIVSKEQWAAWDTSDVHVCGPAANQFGAVATVPQPADLLYAARRLPWSINGDLWRAEPYYLRGSSAEEKVRTNAEPSPGSGMASQAPSRRL